MNRVSENQRFRSTVDRIASARVHADKVQEQAISGRKLHNVSDDPVAVVRSLRNRAKIENIEQFRKTVDFAKGFLSISEDSLRSMSETIIRAKELAIQEANATYDAASRRTVAKEIRQLEEHLVSLGNATYNGRYVFGGYQTYKPPISPDGHYLGDDGVIFVQLNEDAFKPINVPGRSIFGAESEDGSARVPLLQTFRGLAESLEDNNLEGIHKRMSELDRSSDVIINTIATIGSRSAALDDVSNGIDLQEERLAEDSGRIEGADPAETALQLKRAEASLEYTLSSSAKILTPSLLNYLK